jgi:NodT family efflux transporter outer membrane factor (OMF) lipoprotein
VTARRSPAGLGRVRAALTLAAAAALAGCVAGPNYQAPAPVMPVAWKVEAPFREAAPDDAADKGPWWQRFADPTLDELEQQAMVGSPSIDIAAARLSQARAVLAATSSALLPQIGLTTRLAQQRISANRPLTNYNARNFSTTQNDLVVSMAVNYEVDLAGRVQRSIEGVVASAQQSAADLANTRLVLSTDVATNYFNLRSLDTELDVLRRSIALQRRALELVTARHDLGATSGLDVAQQQALLDNTLVQVDVVGRQRGQYEHAIATLIGVAAPRFSLPPDVRERVAPTVPLGVPSDVLQRRPDIASAERAMAAANAQIGVASAAFYPSIVLGPSIGYESRTLASLFDAPSLLWSLGVTATQVVFDSGRLKANVELARGGYELSAANYRRVVLSAMQEVEDGITGLAALDRASAQSVVAADSARRVLDMATARYEGGATTYFDVITAQQGLLNTERQTAQLLGQRLLTSVFLVKALGGDWQRTDQLAAR